MVMIVVVVLLLGDHTIGGGANTQHGNIYVYISSINTWIYIYIHLYEYARV